LKSIQLAIFNKKSDVLSIIDCCWILIVGYQNLHVNSNGNIQFQFTIQFRSMYQIYHCLANVSSNFASVLSKISFLSTQNIVVHISHVETQSSHGNSFLCSKFIFIGFKNLFQLKKAHTAISTPETFF
jgi:hypothetical protein